MKQVSQDDRPVRTQPARAALSDLLAAIVDSSGDAIVSHDLGGLVTSWNHAAEAIYGYRAEEIIGQSVSILLHPDGRQETAAIAERIRQGQRVEHYETVRVTKGGQLIALSLTESPIRDGTGAVIGGSSIARDVTARNRAEAQVAEQRSRELERLAELERFQKLTVGRELKMIQLKKEIEVFRKAATG